MVTQMKSITKATDLKNAGVVMFHVGDLNTQSDNAQLQSLNDNLYYARLTAPGTDKYTNGDIAKVARAVKEYPTACVATTEKDAQRIVDTKKVPETLRKRLFQVPIQIEFLTPQEKEIFETTLLDLLRGLRESY